MKELDIFYNRLKRIGIRIEVDFNLPWIYLLSVNGHVFKDKNGSEYGFCLAYFTANGVLKYSDLGDVFKMLRKYSICNQKTD